MIPSRAKWPAVIWPAVILCSVTIRLPGHQHASDHQGEPVHSAVARACAPSLPRQAGWAAGRSLRRASLPDRRAITRRIRHRRFSSVLQRYRTGPVKTSPSAIAPSLHRTKTPLLAPAARQFAAWAGRRRSADGHIGFKSAHCTAPFIVARPIGSAQCYDFGRQYSR